jgi:hypothetical protein
MNEEGDILGRIPDISRRRWMTRNGGGPVGVGHLFVICLATVLIDAGLDIRFCHVSAGREVCLSEWYPRSVTYNQLWPVGLGRGSDNGEIPRRTSTAETGT